MLQKKSYVISIFIISCILTNLAGKILASTFELPLWLDSFGTVLAAYVCGPICGAIVGVSVNIIANFSRPIYMVYALASILIGVVTGLCARKKMLEDMFGLLSVGFILAVTSVLISTPLNIIFFEGYTNNKWGDGVIDMLREQGVNDVLCFTAGEYYVDFIDKLLTLAALYGLIVIFRRINARKKDGMELSVVFLGLLLCTSLFPALSAKAGNVSETDYGTWLQTVYDDTNGLPGGKTNGIAQTEDGVLWIGTYGGLYRYNGREFQWMNEFESVKNVNCLYTDNEGRLWIGTNDNGLSICINNEIANVIDENSGLPSNSVRCITEGISGNYYVGTTGSMAIVNLSGGLSVVDTVSGINYAKSISADQNGYMAAVTDEGKLFILEESGILTEKANDVQGEGFTCCVFSDEGELYVGTGGNEIIIYKVKDGGLNEKKRIGCGDMARINSINFSDEGCVLVCSDNGIGYIDILGKFHKINANNFNSSIDHMLFDYQGNIWFTSSRLGLLKLCETPFTEIYSKLLLPENVVNAITKWQGKFYFGTDNGLDMADGGLSKRLENSLTEALYGVRVRSFLTDSRGYLWICTSGHGAWRVAKEGGIAVFGSENGALGDEFRSAMEMSDGTIVLAGNKGLTFVKGSRVVQTIGSADGLANPKVLCLIEKTDGIVYAGTDGNGIAVIKDGKVVDTLVKEDGLSSKVILRMVADPKGEGIFIVTSNSLCFMYNNGDIRVLDNFPYYNNYDIIVKDGGELLVLCSAGIYVVDRDDILSEGSYEYMLLDSEKGLRSSLTVNAWNYTDENGYLYLAGDSGVTIMNMENFNTGRRSYRMRIKSIQLDGDSYPVNFMDTIDIPRGTAHIVITPEIVNYSISNPYVSFYLEGFDASPQVYLLSELKDSVYTNLPSGEYTFRLAVLDDRGGILSENTYNIVKETEIYDEKWFKVYVTAVFVLTIVYLTWMLFRTQIQRTLNIQKKELEFAKKQVEMGNEAIFTIAKTVDAKDINTSQHSFRVSQYSAMIAERMGFSRETCEGIRRTALLHDIGKIGIPDSVLNKPGRLTDEEYAIMKSHVTKGAEILKGITSIAHIVEGARYHHERYDGSGYAEGLKGEEIPLSARIIGIADAFDAMTANRVYRKRQDFGYVLDELKKGKGTQFDPRLVDIMLELIEDGTIDVSKLYEDNTSERSAQNEASI